MFCHRCSVYFPAKGQPHPLLPMRRVRHMSGPSPSQLAPDASGSTSSPTRPTVLGAFRSPMSPMMVRRSFVTLTNEGSSSWAAKLCDDYGINMTTHLENIPKLKVNIWDHKGSTSNSISVKKGEVGGSVMTLSQWKSCKSASWCQTKQPIIVSNCGDSSRPDSLLTSHCNWITKKREIFQFHHENLPSESFLASWNMTSPISVIWGERTGSYRQGLVVTKPRMTANMRQPPKRLPLILELSKNWPTSPH